MNGEDTYRTDGSWKETEKVGTNGRDVEIHTVGTRDELH